jgi:hypothetical protein
MAPVTERSGHKGGGHWRVQGPPFLRQTFVEWAAPSLPHGSGAAVSDRQHRPKGVAHQAALRALACTWMRLRSRGWQDHTPDAEATDLTALTRRGSPLLT